MRLCHNMNSLSLFNKYKKNLNVNASSINKISSGVKINRAKDNPDKIGQSESMKIKIRSMQVAQRNMQDGASMLQTADGALQQVNNMLSRIKELAVSAGDGNKTGEEKKIIQNEVNELLKGINDLATNTEFNGIKLIGNEEVIDNNNPKYQVATTGAGIGENMKIPMFNISSSVLADSQGNKMSEIDLLTEEGIGKAMNTIDEVISVIGGIRAEYGAISNKFESTSDRLASSMDMVQNASSKLTDTDIAEEVVKLSKTQILFQTQIALIAQSNDFPKDALKVLDRL